MAETTRHDAWQSGESYDAYTGRWSRRIAPLFLARLERRNALTGSTAAVGPVADIVAVLHDDHSLSAMRHEWIAVVKGGATYDDQRDR